MSKRQTLWVWILAGFSAVASTFLRCSLTQDWTDFLGYIFVFTLVITFLAGLLVVIIHHVGFSIPLVCAVLALGFFCWRFDSNRTFEYDERVGAVAADGFVSSATGQGACSHHGGVARWLTVHRSQALTDQERYYDLFTDYGIFMLPLAALPTAIIIRVAAVVLLGVMLWLLLTDPGTSQAFGHWW